MTTTIKPEEKKAFDTEIRIRRAQFALKISKFILWAIVIDIVFMVTMWVYFWQYTQLQYTQLLVLAVIALPIAMSAGLYPVFYRRNQARIGVYLLLASFILVAFLLPLVASELILTTPILYLVIVVFGYLVLGDQSGRWLTGACILAFVTDIYLTRVWALNWSTPLDENLGWTVGAILSTFVLAVVTLIIRSVILEQEEIFQQSQLANLEIKKRATQLESAKQEIEKRVVAEEKQHEYLGATIDQYVDCITQVAEGNLSARLTLTGNGPGPDDPLLVLGRNLNNMVERLCEMTRQIREAATNISGTAAEILATTTQQAAGASEQSAAISQTTTTIDEVKTIVNQAFSKAQAVAQQAQRTSEVSQTGQQAVADIVENINQLKNKVEGIAENILALSEQTQQIGEITATVDEIASQSNLLALNASVEAARAGEYGKGFAVVAVEVRNLAEQSRQATAQVKTILNEIQRATNTAVMTTEEGTKGVDMGVQLTGQAGETIKKLTSSVNESANAAQQIVASAQQQTAGIEQISLAMQNINQVTVQNLASIRQAEKAAQDLSSLAQQMESLVARYKL
jgi:methyl-accepting chemotaxis protein